MRDETMLPALLAAAAHPPETAPFDTDSMLAALAAWPDPRVGETLDARAAQEAKSQTYDEPLCYALANSGLRSEASLTYLRGTYFRLTLDQQSAPAPAAALVKLDGDKAQVQAVSLRAALRYIPLSLPDSIHLQDAAQEAVEAVSATRLFPMVPQLRGLITAHLAQRPKDETTEFLYGFRNQQMVSLAAVTLGQIGDKGSAELLFHLLSRLQPGRFDVNYALQVAEALFSLGADPTRLSRIAGADWYARQVAEAKLKPLPASILPPDHFGPPQRTI